MSLISNHETASASSCDEPAIRAILNDVSRAQAADRQLDAKILIVDDEPINIKVTQKYLRDGGYHQFLSTNDARQVLPLIHRERPDLVLLDTMMPIMNGLDVLTALQFEADPAGPP